MTTVRGGAVRPHVQAFVNAVAAATGADSFGTYPGHEPTEDRAVDCFVPVWSLEPGTSIAQFAIANMDRFGIWYVIFRQRIYNPEIGRYWRDMEDRGSPTQNHYDHVHVSFYSSAPDVPPPPPPPPPQPKQEDHDTMHLIGVTNNRGIFLVGTQPLTTKAAKGRIPAVYIGTPEEVAALSASGVAVRDESKPDLAEDVFNRRFVVVG